MANCSEIKMDKNVVTFEYILYSPVTLFGVIFNTVALWVFCLKLGKWTETRVYMISLVLADYTLLLTLPFIMFFHYHEWPIDAFCFAVFGISCMNMPMSMGVITLIALDRYIAIKHPLKAKVIRSPRKAALFCLFVGLCCLVYMITRIQSFKIKEGNVCFYSHSDPNVPHALIKPIVFFFMPLLILLYCSIQVIRCLRKKRNASPHEEKLTQKTIWVVSVNLVTFIICFLPFHVSFLLSYVMKAVRGTECELQNVMHTTSCIANLNCCLDAVCYYMVTKEFQEAATLLPPFNIMQSRCKLTQDLQLQSKAPEMAPLQS
ncbi:G-protein coupled receptor 35-like [Zootoca vivipara]|uniref:G-protein coupled receptor 35-like n=1 Tax=Zootoca vivipara TaxID=8524 RepID=UPI00293BDDCB|nr:G-protein coupled receptor 35-like [Zootoca vivipara]